MQNVLFSTGTLILFIAILNIFHATHRTSVLNFTGSMKEKFELANLTCKSSVVYFGMEL